MVKESTYDAGDTGDVGLIPGWGRFPGGGHAAHSSILAWRITWTEEPAVYRVSESQTQLNTQAGRHQVVYS